MTASSAPHSRPARVVVALTGLLVAGPVLAAADWGGLGHAGQPLAAGAEPAAAYLSADRVLLAAGRTAEDGRARLYAWTRQSGDWSPLAGGAALDATEGRDTRAAAVATDGQGHAAVVYAGFEGGAWRLYGRWFDGANFLPLNGGQPVDRGLPGNAFASSAAFLDAGTLALALTQFDGRRTALFVRTFDGAGWADENGGAALDDPAGGWTESPVLAAAPDGTAAVAFVQGGTLGIVRLAAGRWSRLPAPGVPAHTAGASAPAAGFLPDGRLVVAVLRETGEGVSRVFASTWDGTAWREANGGAPVDDSASGVAGLALARDGAQAVQIAYVALDAEGGTTVRAVRLEGVAVSSVNGGAALEAPGAGPVTAVALAVAPGGEGTAGLLAMASGSGGVYVRERTEAPRAAAPAAGPAERPAGVRVVGGVLHAGRGESTRVQVGLDRGQRVRVDITTLTGSLVRVLADGPAAGSLDLAWDGRNEDGLLVAPGAYRLVTRGETLRSARLLVVVR